MPTQMLQDLEAASVNVPEVIKGGIRILPTDFHD
jgi:hypothetical protein